MSNAIIPIKELRGFLESLGQEDSVTVYCPGAKLTGRVLNLMRGEDGKICGLTLSGKDGMTTSTIMLGNITSVEKFV